MSRSFRFITAVVLALSTSTVARAACWTSNTGWQNFSFAAQSAPFTVTFDAVANAAKMDGVTGFSAAPATGFTSLAAIVRFNNAGNIDVRKGGGYAADAVIPYSPGAAYRFRLYVNPSTRRYNVYVTPPGLRERTLAYNYPFRTEQAGVTSLAYWSLSATAGSHQVCNMAVNGVLTGGATSDTTPPTVSLAAPAAGALVSNIVAVSATAGDNKGVAGVQFKLDGANLGAEDTTYPYAVSWNTTLASNAAHTLAAVARDAAGNKTTSAARSVTVSNAAAGSGAAAVRQIYPTAAGGKTWYSKWDNGVARTIYSGGYDPSDAWLKGRGNGSYKVDGKGLLKVSGSDPRLYIADPALSSWRNVEVTVYAMRVSDLNGAGGIVGVARTNHGAYGGLEDLNLCDDRGIGARYNYTGRIDFFKETAHHLPNGTASLSYKTLWSGGMPYNKWIGYKFVVYDLANGNVKLESWLDSNESGNWVKVNEFEDNGANFGVGYTPCKSGINPALRLTNSNARPGSESGKPNVAVYFRSTGVNADGLIYKKMSVREINAP